jgi:hypothetical protein
MPMIHSVQTVHLSCIEIKTISKDRNELLLDPRHLGVQPGPSKIISEPMVHFAQTVHLSYVEVNTTSKWAKMSFHLTHVIKEYQWGVPKAISMPMVNSVPNRAIILRLD